MRKLLTVIILSCAMNAPAQNIAVNTDAVMDVLGVPSAGVEVSIFRRTTIGVNAAYSPSPIWKRGHGFIVQPEYRFYFSGRSMYRHFIGLVGMYSDYTITMGGSHYEGNASGIAVSFGYVLPISKHWSVDFHSSLGAVFFNNKEWDDGDSYVQDSENSLGYVPTNNHGTLCLPSRIGISFTYMIK